MRGFASLVVNFHYGPIKLQPTTNNQYKIMIWSSLQSSLPSLPQSNKCLAPSVYYYFNLLQVCYLMPTLTILVKVNWL